VGGDNRRGIGRWKSSSIQMVDDETILTRGWPLRYCFKCALALLALSQNRSAIGVWHVGKEREACTYDTGSIWPCRPRVCQRDTLRVLRAMVCDPEQDYWRVSPQSSIWREAFCKGAH
jgi:hypothetical protein